MKSKSYEYVNVYNSHYYRTKTKINRQLQRKIEKERLLFSQRQADLDNYQNVWVDYFGNFRHSHFCVFNEDLLTSNLNEKVKEINKEIKELNKSLATEFKLPLQPLRARSIKSLETYTSKYFKFLLHKKMIDRAVYVFERDKKGLWHVHALINVSSDCIFINKLKQFWFLSSEPYIEKIRDLEGSLIYISKSLSKTNLNKIKNLENYNLVGNYSRQESFLKKAS